MMAASKEQVAQMKGVGEAEVGQTEVTGSAQENIAKVEKPQASESATRFFAGANDKSQFKGLVSSKAQILKSQRLEKPKETCDHYYDGKEDMAFEMLIHELIARPKENLSEKMISGCDVFFPDTLFFKNQNPSYIIQMDKDFCLSKWNDEEKKQKPNAGDFIQRIEKATKLRKQNKKKYWL